MTIPPWIPARLTAELRAVASELSYWREKHDGRGRIPESIWAEAVAIAQLEGPIPVAAALQLPLDSLTQRMEEAEEPKFVDLTAEVSNDDVPGPMAVVTMMGPNGEYLRVELTPDAWEAAGVIVDTFFEYLERP